MSIKKSRTEWVQHAMNYPGHIRPGNALVLPGSILRLEPPADALALPAEWRISGSSASVAELIAENSLPPFDEWIGYLAYGGNADPMRLRDRDFQGPMLLTQVTVGDVSQGTAALVGGSGALPRAIFHRAGATLGGAVTWVPRQQADELDRSEAVSGPDPAQNRYELGALDGAERDIILANGRQLRKLLFYRSVTGVLTQNPGADPFVPSGIDQQQQLEWLLTQPWMRELGDRYGFTDPPSYIGKVSPFINTAGADAAEMWRLRVDVRRELLENGHTTTDGLSTADPLVLRQLRHGPAPARYSLFGDHPPRYQANLSSTNPPKFESL